MLDRRVRLRPKPGAENYVYGDFGTPESSNSLLSILRQTNGMVWTYTPTITEQHSANYEMEQPIHTNAGYNNYKNTSNVTINIVGEFISNTPTEALYNLACLHFLRSMTKMDFGRKAAQSANPDYAVVGAPPPILLLSGYGRFMYNDISVIIKSVNVSYPNDVDYVEVPVIANEMGKIAHTLDGLGDYYKKAKYITQMDSASAVYIPQKFTITISLEEQPTPLWMTKKFNLNEFKSGKLLTRRSGGFL